MKFLDKIGDKINEKIDETLNPKVSSTNSNSDWKKEHSKEKLRKHGKEITELEKQMDEFYQNNSYDELLDCCLKILSIDVFHHNARVLKVDALIGLEQFDLAYESCVKLLLEEPNNNNFLAQKSWILYRSGKYVEAIQVFEKLIQKVLIFDPLVLNCKINKAYALSNSGNHEETIEFCIEQLRLHENNEELLMIKNKVEEIQKEKEQKTSQEQNESSQNNSGSSIADELSKFKKLKEQGAITEEEFSEMKKKLMAKM
jgi:tetratricopeptide (TPR) repeat protein